MIWSFEGFFPFVIEFASAFYFAICIILLFLDVPKTEEYLPYRKAKKCMTASYFILGCNLLAWLILTKGGTGSWDEGLNVYVKLSDFLFFYMGMFCFAGAFCYLVDPRYFTPARKKRNVAVFAGALFLMLLSVYFDAYDFSAYFTALAFVTFFVHLVVYLYRFYYLYEDRKKVLEDYFVEDMLQFMFWIKKSLFLLVCMYLLGCLTLVFGIIFNYVCQVYIISVNFYIACSFINYSIKYGEMTHATVTQAEVDDTAKEENKSASAIDAYEQRFGEKLARWMEEKKYLSAQLTIDDLATEMGTNKLYMSRYINRKYEVNFSTLITRLRLSEAKEYMLAHPNVKQEEVALHSGFSSSSYFSKVFSREEGITPVLWRKAQAASLPYEM